MLSLLARLIITAPKRALAAVLLLTVVATGFGATVTEHLGAAGFQDPSSPSARGMKVLTTQFGQGGVPETTTGHTITYLTPMPQRMGGYLRERNFRVVVVAVFR
jgi:hypothetical protein